MECPKETLTLAPFRHGTCPSPFGRDKLKSLMDGAGGDTTGAYQSNLLVAPKRLAIGGGLRQGNKTQRVVAGPPRKGK